MKNKFRIKIQHTKEGEKWYIPQIEKFFIWYYLDRRAGGVEVSFGFFCAYYERLYPCLFRKV